MQLDERSRHHVVCQLFMDHSLQFSNHLEASIYFLSFYCFRRTQLSQLLVCLVSLVTNNHGAYIYLIYNLLCWPCSLKELHEAL